ncbi:acetyl-CoA carboxylase biotin carboxylase subunit [Candidatus Oleimmundimicrobium sp.]|uniref:acetyl-CoA carboxylase biotin carboxylase subunit n=1 Tax=Candidatus Oleimmundimicrobium sp. TaxID=3060597 RepID=UPI002715D955|nr:acetyl-CoA carboxylase biotin carboxylase subunit [Candidatus Oleimmundimicrobium sp.]MDO8886517.1 acetyl-CoA carboxylase biotin carboxylase subunit [Candidatus Oleimmundimicrobium sp.]
MFKKILIANRGEIALRIIRACKELNIPTVAVYSVADRDSLHVKLADEAICIGPAQSALSYLNIPSIISAAELTGAEAIHPGYGFLAENLQFVEICKSCNLSFIGPTIKTMELMGHKASAKEEVKKCGVPVIPGTNGKIKNLNEAVIFANEMGFPVIIKASAGGGGRGMRVAQNEQDLLSQIQTAESEAKAAFGDSEVYIEKYIEEPRHIEFQILADKFGNVIHLGERDCSIQRRHQKLIEESPSVVLSDALRTEMGEMAVKIAKHVNYESAGTIEFLLDKNDKFYFMEMNTRIQVEHPVTEMVTGIDIVKEQIRISAGEKIKHTQDQIKSNGHAIEFRINAEDPSKNFMPQAGEIKLFNPPGGPGVRVDSHIYSGYKVSPYYDSLLAKLIVLGEDREEAIARAKRALGEFVIVGIETIIPFHLKVVDNAFFRKGEVYTNFVTRRIMED